ncbi:flagellar hook-associated protein 2 [Acetitomaculum ruminis DSM 5522]|uniref:Flagellar hook-associated protein 2 n=1 Tax=Acetitomaculum ruminis DSM 5522 TaxID=1120918 RepID=A0A1I0YZ95_9FIRM|nr:flagellar filament capping protein FliD [Acetitomaculum ruminis]SFB18367.1 flagellar hook-associated protein 2 [Acetitomaculum ruminis DSM 5522]
MPALLEAYSYYLSPYTRNIKNNRYDSHKKSELRVQYNNMVRYNTKAPVYMYNRSNSIANFAITVKESARELKNTISEFSDSFSLESGAFTQKAAKSDNDDVVSVRYLGTNAQAEAEDSLKEFNVSVKKLATPQVNLGRFLPNDRINLNPGDYSLNININNMNYEFEYAISEEDTNYTVQNRIAGMLNKASIGIDAVLVRDANNNTSIKLESLSTGKLENGKQIFTISDGSSQNKGCTDYFGLDNIIQNSDNSEFTLNGNTHNSKSNTFTVNNLFELTLNNTSPKGAEPVSIGFKTDVDSLVDNVDSLIKAYNNVITTAESFANEQSGTKDIIKDMVSGISSLKASLEDIGISFGEDGSIDVDNSKIATIASEDSGMDAVCDTMKSLKKSIENEADSMLMDPMRYAQKTLCFYKNPNRVFANPYMVSIYSGMIFNSYC